MIEGQLKQLELSPINVAVVGSSAVGKSSFINAIRGLTADHENAAPVGEFQSALDIRDYLHPRVPELKFWDLPGVSSMQFPKDTYLRDVSFDRFDFFILITAGRFTETDAWLGKEIRNCEKKYFFVRTHVDKDISNNSKAHPDSHNEDELINTIYTYTVEKLNEAGFSDVPVFLVSNYDHTKYDFHRIEQQLIKELPAIRQNAAILYKRSAVRNMIEVAGRCLSWRLWMYSVLSAAVAALPYLQGGWMENSHPTMWPQRGTDAQPAAAAAAALVHNYFVSAGLFAVFVWRWSHICFSHFGLDDSSLKHYARISSVSSRTLKEIVSTNFGERQKKTVRLAGMVVCILSIPAFRPLAGLVFKQYSPYLLLIISTTVSFVSARCFFGYMLKIPKKVALMIARPNVSASEI